MRLVGFRAVCIATAVVLAGGPVSAQQPTPVPGGPRLPVPGAPRLPVPGRAPFLQPVVEVESISLSPAQPTAGQATTVQLTLRNNRAVAADRVGWEIRLDGAVIASGEQPSIAARASVIVTRPWTAAAGTHTFSGVATRIGTVLTGVSRSLQVTVPGATAQLTLTNLTPDNRWFHTPEVETGTVTLSGAAPAGGLVVALSSGNPAAVAVPATVTVPAGQTSATFTIGGASATARGEADVTAALGGSTRSIHLRVDPGTDIEQFTLSTPTTPGGQAVTGTVRLWRPAPAGGAVVALTLGGANVATTASAPASVTIAAGQQQATFQVTTQVVPAQRTVRVCADDPGRSWGCNQNQHVQDLTVTTAAGVGVTRLEVIAPQGSFTTSATVGAGRAVGVAVTLGAAAPAGGAVVGLTSSHPSVVPVPASLTVAVGQAQSVRPALNVTTQAVAAVTVVTLSATYGGLTQTATVTVQPEATVSGVVVAPASVTGGGVATGTVTLTQAAPAEGTPVALTSSGAAATVPARVTVGAGQTSASFSIATQAVTAPTAVTIGAAYAGVSRSGTLEVRP